MDSTLTLPPKTADTTAHSAEMEARAEIIRRFSDSDLMTKLIRKGARAAMIEHKQKGVTVSSWENGKLVITQPEDIVIPDDED